MNEYSQEPIPLRADEIESIRSEHLLGDVRLLATIDFLGDKVKEHEKERGALLADFTTARDLLAEVMSASWDATEGLSNWRRIWPRIMSFLEMTK